jgi:hypothetical protein
MPCSASQPSRLRQKGMGIQVEGHAKAVTELCAAFDRYRKGSSACPWWPAGTVNRW